ncbi:MAG: hypothetical protein IPN77_20205 [Sandaracinaceae bacterium]|nr:hypothetical protein [Sandaracinaceae bacterium]
MVGAGVDAETGSPWLAMELLEGGDLAARVAWALLGRGAWRRSCRALRHGLGASARPRHRAP